MFCRPLRSPGTRLYYGAVLKPIKQTGPRAPHVPVMAKEVLEYLKPENDQTILDMTFGAGGHSRMILERAPNCKLLALDRDPEAHKRAKEFQQEFPNNVVPLLGRFSDLPQLLKDLEIRQQSIDAILLDLGASSMQFDTAERGFALSRDGPLDMRMDQSANDDPTATDILKYGTEKELAQIFKIYGEEKKAKTIARAIIDARYSLNKIETTKQLAELVASCFETIQFKRDKMNRPAHPATKVFQALRIFVNNELNELDYAMVLADHYLKYGGRLVALTFHSLEDIIVKRHIQGNVIENTANPIPLKYSSYQLTQFKESEREEFVKTNWYPLHKHVLMPKFEEIEMNPRCRSAKMRAAVKVS